MTIGDPPSKRWRKIVEEWSRAGLGEEPPAWLAEYPTQAELTLEQLHSEAPLLDDDSAWDTLVEAFNRAGAGPPSSRLRAHARAILSALVEPEDEG